MRHAYADAHTYGYANPDTHADASTYGNPNTYAHTHTYTDARDNPHRGHSFEHLWRFGQSFGNPYVQLVPSYRQDR